MGSREGCFFPKSDGLHVPDNVWVSNGYDGLSLNRICLDQFKVVQRTMRSQTIFKVGTQPDLKDTNLQKTQWFVLIKNDVTRLDQKK